MSWSKARRGTRITSYLHNMHRTSLSTREIVVQFNADVGYGMQWKFTPTQREVRVKPGESALAFYTTENKSSAPITEVSTYNVTPMKAGVYFNKIQCFCFEEQRLLPSEQIDMPVFCYIDPELRLVQEWTESTTSYCLTLSSKCPRKLLFQFKKPIEKCRFFKRN